MDHKKNVILSMPAPATWTFMSYETELGKDVIRDWDVTRTFEAEESFWAAIRNSRKINDYRQWPCWHHRMSGEAGGYGLVELRFPADKRQYRVIARFSGKRCLVLLCICYHKGSIWTPTSAIQTATQRAKALDAGKGRLNVINVEQNF